MAGEIREDTRGGQADEHPVSGGDVGQGEETPDCAELLTQKDEEVKQLKDRILRQAAEMDNTRKRLEREKSEGVCYANESLIREFLPVIDNLERAIQHGEKEADYESLMSGVRMTLKGFQDALSRFGCESFESRGKPFDPNYHEAVAQHTTAEYPDKSVIEEYQKGYTLRDRLVRPATVVVARNPEAEETKE